MIDWDAQLLAPLYAAFGETAQYEAGGRPGQTVVVRRNQGDRDRVLDLGPTRVQAGRLVLLARVSSLSALGITPAKEDVVVFGGVRRIVQAPPRRVGQRELEWELDTAPEDAP